jgi:16S rRNA (cytosine967-C5)-methyltransferase
VEQADVVLADLPCSGLGVIGRKPDIKYRMTKEQQQELAALQQEILHTVASYVKPKGVLLYSTCTIGKCENQDNVRRFLEGHPEFQLEEEQQILPKAGLEDGFFYARLRKNPDKGGL